MSNNKLFEASEVNKCKRCKNTATVGLKCINCGIVSHKSCIKAMKNAMIIDENSANCCLGDETLQSVSSKARSSSIPRTPNSSINDKSSLHVLDTNEIKVFYLEELVKQKDITIKNQDIAIQSLQEQIVLLKKGLLTNSTQNIKRNDQTAKPSTLATQSNANKQISVKKHNFTSNEVSNAVHNAETVNLCSNIINIDQDADPKSEINSKPRKKPKTLLVGKSNFANLNLKAAEKVSVKHFHVTNMDPETEIDQLRDYLSTFCPDIKVEKLKARYPELYSSFKLSLPEQDVEKIMIPENWPEGVVLNHFFQPRRNLRKAQN